MITRRPYIEDGRTLGQRAHVLAAGEDAGFGAMRSWLDDDISMIYALATIGQRFDAFDDIDFEEVCRVYRCQ